MSSTTLAPTPSSDGFLLSTFSATVPFSSLTNVVALTTPFTYEAECLSRWLLSTGRGSTATIYSTSPSGSNTDPLWTSCQPFNYQTLYSPAMCPEGRTLASVHEGQFGEGNYRIAEWLGICCEKGFALDTGWYCTSTITTPVRVFVPFTSTTSSRTVIGTGLTSTVTTMVEEFFPISTNDVWSFSGEVPQDFVWYTTSSSTTTITRAEAWAEALVVLWQSSDLSKFPPAYAASLAKRIGIEYTGTATPGATAQLPGQTSVPSTGLGTGARAGIGVGVSVFALFFMSFAAFLILRRRSRSRKPLPTDQPEFMSRSS